MTYKKIKAEMTYLHENIPSHIHKKHKDIRLINIYDRRTYNNFALIYC